VPTGQQGSKIGLKFGRAAVGGMTDIRRLQGGLGQPSDRDHTPSTCELAGEDEPRVDLRPCGLAIRALRSGMGRDDVPEQQVVSQAEFGEHALDDGRRRFRWTGAAQLPLGGEGKPRDAGAAVARRLAHEQDRSVRACLEVDAHAHP
jgi:hypothetical protein